MPEGIQCQHNAEDTCGDFVRNVASHKGRRCYGGFLPAEENRQVSSNLTCKQIHYMGPGGAAPKASRTNNNNNNIYYDGWKLNTRQR